MESVITLESNNIPLFTKNMDAFNHNIAIKPWIETKYTAVKEVYAIKVSKREILYFLVCQRRDVKNNLRLSFATLESYRELGQVNFRKDFWDCYWEQ